MYIWVAVLLCQATCICELFLEQPPRTSGTGTCPNLWQFSWETGWSTDQSLDLGWFGVYPIIIYHYLYEYVIFQIMELYPKYYYIPYYIPIIMIYQYIPYLYAPLSILVLSLPKNIQKPISDVHLKPPAAEAHQLSPVAPGYSPGAGSVRSPSGDHLGDVIWSVWSDLQHPYIYIYILYYNYKNIQ